MKFLWHAIQAYDSNKKADLCVGPMGTDLFWVGGCWASPTQPRAADVKKTHEPLMQDDSLWWGE